MEDRNSFPLFLLLQLGGKIKANIVESKSIQVCFKEILASSISCLFFCFFSDVTVDVGDVFNVAVVVVIVIAVIVVTVVVIMVVVVPWLSLCQSS